MDVKLANLKRPKAITLTPEAVRQVLEIIGDSDRQIAGLRIGVKNAGCAGMAYTMEYAEQINPSDEVVEDHGVTIMIEPSAVLFLIGTEMDYKVEKMSSGFIFNNPNVTDACGCGESVSITPADPEQIAGV